MCLGEVFVSKGFETTIYQESFHDFERDLNGMKVIGIDTKKIRKKNVEKVLVNAATKNLNGDEDIIVFGSEKLSVDLPFRRSISIQHGIGWDLPVQYLTKKKCLHNLKFGFLFKYYLRYLAIKKFKIAKYKVCVDYNFVNWYRTFTSKQDENIFVIPNFAKIFDSNAVHDRKYDNDSIKILFARRFIDYRGTKIAAKVFRRLLDRYANISVTFAGEGPDEDWLRNEFRGENRVEFIKYLSTDSMKIHFGHDLAIVPSLASEGTSLSVIEAMACGCPVIASAVGGITNIIINNHNGILVKPGDSVELESALDNLIIDRELRQRLGINGYQTVKDSFSLKSWKENWSNIIDSVIGGC
jgi:glycosyltransferase involved in cell wall biosynthesis